MDKKVININIEALLKELEKLKEKNIKDLQLKGTLLVEGDGNRVLYTNQKQW